MHSNTAAIIYRTTFYVIDLIHLVRKEMDIDPVISGDSRGHDDFLLEGFINNIKNADKYEEVDEDDDINR
jgi:hypothetical protein